MHPCQLRAQDLSAGGLLKIYRALDRVGGEE
jgi:hypothetical protein